MPAFAFASPLPRFRSAFSAFFLSFPVLAAALLSSTVHAEVPPQSGVVKAGPQEEPPQAAPLEQRTLAHDLGQRRAIRGCEVGTSCQGFLQDALREFEKEAFPRASSGSPWVDSQAPGLTKSRTSRAKGETQGIDLRPDLPWLKNLRMPDVPVRWTPRLIKYLEFYKNDRRGRNIMSAWLRAQGQYRAPMIRVLRENKLPDALVYISMIESSYSPHEYSRVGASGLWQFMPAAGHIYGLTQNRWIDERNDPDLSTQAVASYFQDLYDRFGDWDLAMAAFNCGYGCVINSIAKYNTNDYWQLVEYENGLPWGTSNYVAKWLATAIVGENLEVFGYQDVEVKPEVKSDWVSVPKSVALGVIARAAGTSVEEIQFLNPQLRRNRTPPGVANYRLRVPVGKAEEFAVKFPQMRSDWDDVDAYVARHGERFEDIATTYGISRAKLRKLNGLSSEVEVRGGMVLVVPKVDPKITEANAVEAETNLYESGVPEAETDEGERMLVPLPRLDIEVEDRKRYFYRVVYADTQARVAQVFGVDRLDLAAWNGLAEDAHLHPRMILQVWAPKSFDPEKSDVKVLDETRLQLVQAGSAEHLQEAERRIGRRRRTYTPTRPESIETIAAKFGLGKYDLARINQRSPSSIVGTDESILVYEVEDPKESDRAARQAKELRKQQRKRKR